MIAAVLCRRLLLFKQPYIKGGDGGGKWQAVAVAQVGADLMTRSWMAYGLPGMDPRGSPARPRPQTHRDLLPGSAPLVYVPYLTAARLRDPVLQAQRLRLQVPGGYMMTPQVIHI